MPIAIFGHEVDVPEPCEYVALGAARQAAWALADTPEPGTPPFATPPAISATTRADARLAPFPHLNQTFKIREFATAGPPFTAPED